MKRVKITAVRQTVYPDLMAKYENPIEHACDIHLLKTQFSATSATCATFTNQGDIAAAPILKASARVPHQSLRCACSASSASAAI